MTTTQTNAVKIGKTVYEITGAMPYSRPGTVWALRKASTVKTLIYDEQNDSYTLWSGRVGLPKQVQPEFLK